MTCNYTTFFINFASQLMEILRYNFLRKNNVMNNLFQHIEYLLLTHDCVIVPGLGAFIASVSPTLIDLDKGIITPPLRSVMFNQAVSSDDGLLANSFVRKYNVSFEDARQIILRESSLLREKIAKVKEIRAGKLGTLHLGDEGNLVFIPSSDEKNSCKALGFESLFFNNTSENSAKANASDNLFNQAQLCEPTQKRRNLLKIGKSFSKIAAAFVIIATVFFVAFFYPIPTDNREQRASVVPVDAIMPIMIAIPSEDTDTSCYEETQDAQIIDDKLTHYLIVATFSNDQEALNYISLNSSQDCPMNTVQSKKVTRVAIAASDDREQLRRQLNSKEIRTRFPNAWIWSRQQNQK